MHLPPLRVTLPLVLGGVLNAHSAWSAEARLQIQMPASGPYVAVWLENPANRSFVANLAVWYDTGKRGNRGARWLPDLRQWWRMSGGTASLKADGVTGATRAPGVHTIDLATMPPMASLPPGTYEVVVEATREHGGYDLLRLPFVWPSKDQVVKTAKGREEVGTVRLTVGP